MHSARARITLQNFPIVVAAAGGGLEGWLSGSTPDTTFRIDVYASTDLGPGGAGEAQDYLGSLQVTTDSQGQSVFDVPFTAPAGLPIVTATATDPQGNTSELGALRRATVEMPAQSLRLVPGQTPIFSTATGDEIALQDPDAGPLDPAWDLTLSVGEGTLALSSLAGLVGLRQRHRHAALSRNSLGPECRAGGYDLHGDDRVLR